MEKIFPKQLCFLMLILCFLTPSSLWGQGHVLTTEMHIAPGQWSLGRLRNVPANAQLQLELIGDGSLVLLLLTKEQLQTIPNVNEPMLYVSVARRFAAKMTILVAGDYYLLFWNKDTQKQINATFRGGVIPLM